MAAGLAAAASRACSSPPATGGFVARLTNDAYADTRAAHPTRFRCFASRPMVSPDEALKELDRAINT